MSEATNRQAITASRTVAGLRRPISQSQSTSTADDDKTNAVVNIDERNDNEVAQNGTTAVPASADTDTTDLYNSVTEAINDTEDQKQAVFIRELTALNEEDFVSHFMTLKQRRLLCCSSTCLRKLRIEHVTAHAMLLG